MYLVRFTLRRVLESIPLLFGLVTLVFVLSRLLPGDATAAFLSPNISPAVAEQLKLQFGLDRPLLEQYCRWLAEAVRGNFGYSFSQNAAVTDVVGRFFPNTVLLGVSALALEILVGVALAGFIFLFSGTKSERFLSHALLVCYAVPSFWIGLLMLMLFSYTLGWFPSSQMAFSGEDHSVSDTLSHLVLPACALALPAAAGIARYLRVGVTSAMKQEYVLAARSMGLSDRTIFRSYILPNALSPLISLVGIEIGVLLTGVLVTEKIFSWPGMGLLTINAIGSRDYPLILGCTLVAGVVVIAGNFLADVVNAMIDPRIREQS